MVKMTSEQVKNQINKIGSKSKPAFKFIKIAGLSSSGSAMVTIQNISTKEILTRDKRTLLRGNHPWRDRSRCSVEVIKNRVNKLGARATPTFRFIRDTGTKTVFGKRLIEIQNCLTGKNCITSFDKISIGQNPWNTSQDCHEKRIVHPQILKMLKKMNLKIDQEVVISSKSRLDFICTNKDNRKIQIEVKSDKKQHSRNSLKEQISRYKSEGKRKYGNNYAGTFLVSLTGKYGLSIKELPLILKAKGLI
jgi:hypothetical protein